MEMPSPLLSDGALARALGAILRERFSCRGYLPDEVPAATVGDILTLAQRTASWCNTQPWSVIVTAGEATRDLVAALCKDGSAMLRAAQPDYPWPKGYGGVYDERRRECGKQLYQSLGIARGDQEAYRRQLDENLRLFGAPHVAIVTADRDLGVYGAVDCGGYVNIFMAAAQALGVASIAQAALAGCAPILRRHLDVPEDRAILCGIAFGYADPDHPANAFRTSRASVETVASLRGFRS